MTGKTLTPLVIPEGLIGNPVFREYPEKLCSFVSLKWEFLYFKFIQNRTTYGLAKETGRQVPARKMSLELVRPWFCIPPLGKLIFRLWIWARNLRKVT